MFLVSSSSCLCPIYWSQVLSWEWRCSWEQRRQAMLQLHPSDQKILLPNKFCLMLDIWRCYGWYHMWFCFQWSPKSLSWRWPQCSFMWYRLCGILVLMQYVPKDVHGNCDYQWLWMERPSVHLFISTDSSWIIREMSHECWCVSNNRQIVCLFKSLLKLAIKSSLKLSITVFFISGIHRQ